MDRLNIGTVARGGSSPAPQAPRTPVPVAALREEQARTNPRSGPIHRGARPAATFKTLLAHRRETGPQAGDECERSMDGGPPLQAWRPEPPAIPDPGSPSRPGAVSAGSTPRVLARSTLLGHEVRLTFGAGPLAGSEIRLVQGCSHIDADVLTRDAASQEILVSAMVEVSDRLRARGLTMKARVYERAKQRGQR